MPEICQKTQIGFAVVGDWQVQYNAHHTPLKKWCGFRFKLDLPRSTNLTFFLAAEQKNLLPIHSLIDDFKLRPDLYDSKEVSLMIPQSELFHILIKSGQDIIPSLYTQWKVNEIFARGLLSFNIRKQFFKYYL